MEYEEAIDRIKPIADSSRNVDQIGMFTPKPITVALEMAICALEKQIPMKPQGDFDSVPHYRCAKCFSAVKVYDNSFEFPFCPWCGQKIDWEE